MRKLLLAISLVFTLNAQADNNESLMLDDQLNISQNIWVESVITKIKTYWRYSGARGDWFCMFLSLKIEMETSILWMLITVEIR